MLVLYEGGAVASYNLTHALVASAEYAAGGATPPVGERLSLSAILIGLAVLALLLGVTMLSLGMRLGVRNAANPSVLSVVSGAVVLAGELVLTPVVAVALFVWPTLRQPTTTTAVP